MTIDKLKEVQTAGPMLVSEIEFASLDLSEALIEFSKWIKEHTSESHLVKIHSHRIIIRDFFHEFSADNWVHHIYVHYSLDKQRWDQEKDQEVGFIVIPPFDISPDNVGKYMKIHLSSDHSVVAKIIITPLGKVVLSIEHMDKNLFDSLGTIESSSLM
jgi:hypothetical protein